ncbi:hypothetical protein DCO45_02695 [Comamonas sp. JNW]|nr:hypothetical protein DCO45_02695 [Comamonas sp. JNW]
MASLAFGSYWLFEANTSAGLAGLGAGLVLLFGATIDQFEMLKGLGVEAKTRIDQKVNEAEKILAQMKSLAASTASSLIEFHVAESNQPTGGGVQYRVASAYDKVQRTKEMMAATGSSQDAMRTAMTPWLVNTAHALYGHLATPIHAALRIRCVELKNAAGSKESIEARINSINDFLHGDRKTLREQTFSDLTLLIEGLSNAPELDEKSRVNVAKLVKVSLSELAYLNEELAFKNRYYWENLPQLTVELDS